MIPHEKLTFIRNRHRARDLRIFRELVETYFERVEYEADDLPVDWEGVRSARSQINRMLPRVIEIVNAAGLDTRTANVTNPGPSIADPKVLRNIFNARYADGSDQEILDLLDMAIGVYDAGRFNALVRTVNPLHYVVTTLVFAARIPGRALSAVIPRRSRTSRIKGKDAVPQDAVPARLAEIEDVIEARFAEMRERQVQYYSESAGQLADLAERLDFAERMLAQQRPPNRLKAPGENDVATPA